jgi:hypothetical protein
MSCSERLSTTANGLLADCKVAGCLEISTFQSDPSYTVYYKRNTKRYQVFFSPTDESSLRIPSAWPCW